MRLPPIQALATVLHYCGATLRWEPLNIAKLHRGIPSPRASFPCEIFVRTASETHMTVWRYLGDYHALELIERQPPTEAAGEVGFGVIGNLRRIAAYYGEFSPFLIALEAGHLSAQLRLLAGAVGFEGIAVGHSPDECASECFGQADWMRTCLSSSSFAIGAGALDLEALPLETLRVSESVDDGRHLEMNFPTLRPVVEACARAPAHIRPPDGVGSAGLSAPVLDAAAQVDILDAIRRRSSGQDGWGYAPRGDLSDRTAAESVFSLWSAMVRRDDDARRTDHDITVYASILNVRGLRSGLYACDPATGELNFRREPSLTSLFTEFVGLGYGYNFSEFSFVLSFTCDLGRLSRRLGASTLNAVHGQVGRLAQLLCLAASAHDLFARPIRSYSEPAIEAGLGVSGQVIYQVLCGYDRLNSIYFEIG